MGSAAAEHSHAALAAVAATSASSSSATPLAGDYDEFFSGYLESPTYHRTRLVLSPGEIEAKLRAGMIVYSYQHAINAQVFFG